MKVIATAALLSSIAGVSAQAVTSIISAPGSAPSGCALSQQGVFGIQVVALPASSTSSAAIKKRQVSQIADGQIQATSAATPAAPVSQIADGQIQATSAVARPAVPVSQIADGQIQAATSTPVAPVTVTVTKDLCVATPITQISDGQIQAPMATPITQIGDGQIQAPTTKAATATPVSQISDGQIQATSAAKTGSAVQQIGDGQLQASTTLATSTKAAAGMSTGTSSAGYAQLSGAAQACASSGTLKISLENGVLTDSSNRTGYIAANSQFQFDDPPQAGAIYTAGWSLCSNGSLALGGATTFYQCLSGSFYNLYLNNILSAGQCEPVSIEAIQLNSC